MIKPYAARSNTEMKDVLMNPELDGPEFHYHMVRGGDTKTNITIWESGKVGGEYIKSYGHYHTRDFDEIYTVLQGEGILLLQSEIKDDSVSGIKAIKVKAGDVIQIPLRAGHLMINTGSIWLVTSDNSPADLNHADYSLFKKFHGAAYYAAEKNGKVIFEKNPHYKDLPEIEIV